MVMIREMILMVKCASTIATLNTESKTSAQTIIHTKMMKVRKRKNLTWPNTSNVNRPSSKTTTKNVEDLRRKKKLNTSLDHTVPNKEELSSWVYSLMTHAHHLPTITVVPTHTATWQENRFPTPRKVSSRWTALTAKNPKISTMTETTRKMRMRSLRCVNKFMKVPESASKGLSLPDTYHQPTTMRVTTLLESRLFARMESSPRLDQRLTKLLRSSLASSLLPLCFLLLMFTT
mmetsp:Transcript_15888/g.36777  ORF Transcript_15888/g.36777 Transcript_15888/m.36777 type:complete len:233 (-) Transcript_15888:309-1007(-)